jgi:SseB protein N-terminal domain
MWLFDKLFNKKIPTTKVTTANKPVENPALETAMFRHKAERSERTAVDVGKAMMAATFLVPLITDELKISPSENNLVTFEVGSIIKFMTCLNTSGKPHLPAFTSWHELRLWAGNEVSAFAMGSHEMFEFALSNSNSYSAIVINPSSAAWNLEPENIRTLLDEFKS